MKQNSIFRDELPGEKKSIINLLMTGYIVVISCLGYAAFFLYIQLGQIERIVGTMDAKNLAPDQMELLKSRIIRSAGQLKDEMIGMSIVGSLVSVIGGFYTINMVIRPLKKLVQFAEAQGKTELPEIKSNTDITIKLLCRIDTIKELDYYKQGGILQYVLNSIIKKAS